MFESAQKEEPGLPQRGGFGATHCNRGGHILDVAAATGIGADGCAALRGVMADHLKVDPIDLHMSSDHMDMHHTELLAAHAAANSVIEEAQAGWVGASAAALQSKLAEWQATTTRLCGDIAAHSASYRVAADGYTENDSNSAEALDGTL